MSVIKQKDYLKKYLSIGKDSTERKKKKKKIKSNNAVSRLVIIDDNADTFENAVKEDLLVDEDAPQIVAVIDDRPPSLRVDEKSNTHLWIPIGSNNGNFDETSSNSPTRSKNTGDLSPPRNRVKLFARKDDDMSPPRRKSSIKHYADKNTEDDNIKVTEIYKDISPPRKDSKRVPPKTSNKKKSSRWDSEDLDVSPPSHFVAKKSDECENEKDDDDNSPPRKRSQAALPKLANKMKSSRWESEKSSSPRHHAYDNRDENEGGKPENKCNDEDNSPPRKRSKGTVPKMMKTLDGKTAGLQNAKQLAAETTLFKEKEVELFNQMSSEISGVNASTIVRDKKTGRVRNFQEEAARELEKKMKEDVNKEKYSRWGRGLKQVEDATKRRDEVLNEMSKPLARYANDEDLEKYLKQQEREGDPMLAYIRKKKKKQDVEEGKPMKPDYMGEFMPNRFGIRPGHRWDGVDRSNGYEKKWFDIQNSRMAQQEEAYKWSIEDM